MVRTRSSLVRDIQKQRYRNYEVAGRAPAWKKKGQKTLKVSKKRLRIHIWWEGALLELALTWGQKVKKRFQRRTNYKRRPEMVQWLWGGKVYQGELGGSLSSKQAFGQILHYRGRGLPFGRRKETERKQTLRPANTAGAGGPKRT